MSDLVINVKEAQKSLTEKAMFAASAERIIIQNELKDKFLELPQPLRFSRSLSVLLSRVSTPVEDHDIIAGRCIDRELDEEEEEILSELSRYREPKYKKAFMSSGHCTYSWDMVVEKGISGMRLDAVVGYDSSDNEDKKIFYLAMIEIYDAISEYLNKYANEAEKKGLHELSQNLREISCGAPESFASALQLLWIITLIDCAYITQNPTLTVGRLDKILYPVYEADIKKGTLTRERAKDYVTDYYCKHNLIMGRGEHQLGDASNSTTWKRIFNFDAPQYLLLGGTDEKGNTCINELTQIFAECIEPSFKNPVVVVRYVKDMDRNYPKLWSTLIHKATQSSSLMFYNDENVSATLRRIGLSDEDSRGYAHFGCNWCSPGDNAAWMNGGPSALRYEGVFNSEEERAEADKPYLRMNAEHGWPEDLMKVLDILAKRDDGDYGIDDVYKLFFDVISEFVERRLKDYERELKIRQRRPSAVLTYGDCFLRNSLEKGECISASAKYHFELQTFQMFGTVVDSIIAVDQLVFREKKLTLSRLLEAVRADFRGYDEILALCRRADKYGMDTPLSNYHVKRLAQGMTDIVIEKNRPYFERCRLFLTPCLQSDTWHIKTGIKYGATPDGRRAYTPFSQNARPSNGVCVNGITAMLNSMLNIPTDGFVSGALNLDIDSKQYATENGREALCALLATYLNCGGLHAQVSSIDPDRLLAAKNDPDKYRDIRVRVTGYSGIFVDMCESLQNDIIERMK